MISRKLAWAIALGFLGVLAAGHWAGSYPARVVLINQGGTLQGVQVSTGRQTIGIGKLTPGETRVVKIESGDYLTVQVDASRHRRWQSPDKIAPAQSLILALRDERVEIQRRSR
ncbi:MAG: hypothetical protein NVSMB68_08780 [Thermoanaerobaculia bacterium]